MRLGVLAPQTTTFLKLQVLSAQMFSVSAGERAGCVHLATPNGISPPTSIFENWVCNYTLQGDRDVEPAVQLHSKKELPLLRSENSRVNAGSSQ